jgi:poly-gamma-glutamate capsule biosynthesis protein CapA/YwtB (metallophosphatase superfamily)
VDYGADAVVGHHPHVIQPFEVYRGRPIFYSVGNFAFGSGNSRAEGLGVELRFEERRTIANLYPLYVKNRDPRVAYQPKVLTGKAAESKLRQLVGTSGPSGPLLRIEKGRGTLDLPWQATK